ASILYIVLRRHDVGTTKVQLVAGLVEEKGIGIIDASAFLLERNIPLSIRAKENADAVRPGIVQRLRARLGVHDGPPVVSGELAYHQIGDTLHQKLPASGRRIRFGRV